MSPEELDTAIGELETRLERLRSLYEQYFLGIEKIAPSVARKDVDRRIWELRKEKIRNTAKRFKLQTIIMRYNTFQQYWQRICREIENGTYKRHVLRTERSGKASVAERTQPDAKARPPTTEGTRTKELERLLDSATDLDAELTRALNAATSAAATAPTLAVERQGLEKLDLDIEEIRPKATSSTEAPSLQRPPASVKRSHGTARAAPKKESSAAAGARENKKPTAGGSGLTDARVQQLYQQLGEAKARTREANKVSVAGVAKSLRAAESKLQARYKNRKVDFDVVIKNGRAIFKPVLR